MRQYLDLVQHVLDNGVEKQDRTGTGTLSVFGYQMRFDLQKGFPLLTTKKLHWKSICHELLYFINGIDNNNLLKEKGVNIWNEWGDSNGNLGAMYGQQLRNFGGQHNNRPQSNTGNVLQFDIINNNSETLKSKYGDYKIIEELKNWYVLIQFQQTGYKYVVRKDHAKTGSVYDPFYNSGFTHGFLGLDYKKYESEHWFNKLKNRWSTIIQRCYNKNKDNYKYYGGKGVIVNDRWLNFSNFILDVQLLPNWDELINNTELDKDILGDSFEYSYDKCCWVTKEQNMSENVNHLKYTVKNNASGGYATLTNAANFMITHNIKNQGNFNSMLRGKRQNAEGWSLIKLENTKKGIDQLSDLIHSIKINPFSRRHIITLWNPLDLKHQSLACCHGTTIQFNVYEKDNKRILDCSMNQRSGDTLLGIPYNIASYALLIHMIAQVCGLQVGEFIHTIGDAHIYLNHIEQCKLQLTREPLPLCELKLNPEIKDIFEFKYEDIEIVNYQAHPHIKGKVAV